MHVHLENKEYWSRYPCGNDFSNKEPYSSEFFREVEAERYRRQPFVFSFAQFPHFSGKKVMEVGVGLGIDFLQWVRAGAYAYPYFMFKKLLMRKPAREEA